MLNLVELERKWLRYKIKSIMPYTLLSTVFITGIAGYFIYQNYQTDSKNAIKPIVKNKKRVDLNKSSVIVAKVTTEKKNREKNTLLPKTKIEVVKLEPSMEFIDNFKPLESNTPKQSATQEKTKKELAVKKSKKQISVSQKNISSKITIKKQDTAKDIENILKRFQTNKNPALSLFLAKKYYELGDYKNASNYALITNKMNRDIEDSWLIFTKSLVKLNQKDKAIEILTEYIKNTQSNNAAILLNQIQSGAFK